MMNILNSKLILNNIPSFMKAEMTASKTRKSMHT